MKINRSTFIISDHHFFHKNIIAYENRPLDYIGLLVKRHNEVVGTDSTVFFLGDLTFGGKDATFDLINKMRGNKYLILGNHDHHGDFWYEAMGLRVCDPAFRLFRDGNKTIPVLFTHEPVRDLPKNWWNVHGHIHSGRVTEFPMTDHHINVSCEVLNYTPVTVGELLLRAGAISS